MNRLFLILLLGLLGSCYLGEELPPDQKVWEYAHPLTLDMDEDRLYKLDESLKEAGFGLINGLILIKGDQMVFENYYNGSRRSELQPMGRLSFTVIALAVDLFIEQGTIESIDDPIYPYLPEYEDIFVTDTIKRQITFRHILSNKLGISWDETGRETDDYGQMRSTDDWVYYILSKPRDTPTPGLRFSLHSGGGILLARIMQNILKDEALEDFINDQLFDKIGVREFQWEKSPIGTLNGANGLQLSAIDMTRIGYLMIQEGRWTDKLRVLNRDWIFDVTSAQSIFDNRFSYGYGWKILTDEFKAQIGIPGTSTFYIEGGQGQSLFIIPELELTVAITADNFMANAETISFNIFLNTVLTLPSRAVN